MKPIVSRIWLLAAMALSQVLLSTNAQLTEAKQPPNIILILMDDMGWRDVGFMGNHFVETPNIDQLASSGLVFTQAYASAPNCAPTRACLMSGQYTPRHGIYTVVDPRQPPGSPWHKLKASESKSELSPAIETLAESLARGGYETGFFGMWNLGRGRSGPVSPKGQGFHQVVFPETIGFAKDAYFDSKGNYLSDQLTAEVNHFITQNQHRPFFVYLPDHAVHAPFNPKPELLMKYEQKLRASRDSRDDPQYAATIEAVDQNVGRIVDTLRRLKILDNTLIVFTSDNGGTNRYTSPLRGSKGELYEGGIRVPLVVNWSGIKHPGTHCEEPVSSVDFYPTFLELSGTAKPEGQTLDGVSLVPLLEGARELDRSELYWHFPCYVGRATPASAYRNGDFKLIEFFEDGGRRELYDLRQDPEESTDLALKLPEKLTEMTVALHAWQESTGASLPTEANPNYDPKQTRPRGGQQPSRGGRQRQ